AIWHDDKPDTAPERAKKHLDEAIKLGAKEIDTLEHMLDQVDGVVMVQVNGNKHFDLARPVLEHNLPLFIDKPMTCNLDQARKLLDETRRGHARIFSSSSLRWVPEIATLDRAALGKLVAIDAFGPSGHNPTMEGLYFYGVHVFEMIDQIWGPGVKRICARQSPDREVFDLEYTDGRYARGRLDRKGKYHFGATVHGEGDVKQFIVSGDVYLPMVKGMVKFFEGAEAPVKLRDIVENIAVMSAGNESMTKDGAWVDVQPIE
ncbi:MAG TPA: Gfo/Idh/MocA family oxidoreductase, partial [Tepidisphaeraceae bacterium]|nr:Gfo/Idh/MocA family oxidoreductase [Tepidisphaeraceae bacterium]